MEGDELDFLNFALSRRRRSEQIVVADVATTQTEQNVVAEIEAEQIVVADTPVCRKRKFTQYTDDGRRVRTVKPGPPMSKELSMARAREALAKKRFAALKKVGLTVVQEVCNVVAQKSKLRISLGGLARQLQKQTRKKRSLATLDADCVQITRKVVLAAHFARHGVLPGSFDKHSKQDVWMRPHRCASNHSGDRHGGTVAARGYAEQDYF